MFHTRDHFVPLARICIYTYILSSFSNSTSFSIQPMRAPPTLLVTISHVLFVLFVLFFSPPRIPSSDARCFEWNTVTLGSSSSSGILSVIYYVRLVRIYRVAEIDCRFDNRRIFVALEEPRFTERERIQIYSGDSWKYYRKILMKVCR